MYIHVGENDTVVLGSGRLGDRIERIVIVPSSTVITGTLSIRDGSDTAMIIYDADSTILPTTLHFGIQAANAGGWTITTGAGITAIIIGEW